MIDDIWQERYRRSSMLLSKLLAATFEDLKRRSAFQPGDPLRDTVLEVATENRKLLAELIKDIEAGLPPDAEVRPPSLN